MYLHLSTVFAGQPGQRQYWDTPPTPSLTSTHSFPPCFLRSTQLSTAQSQVLTTGHSENFTSSCSEVCVGAVTGDNWHPSDNSSMTVTCVAVTYMRHVTCILSYLHDTYTHLDKVGCFFRILFIDYSSTFNTIAASFASRKAN